ncbi:hypothetical protein R1sor_024129 [Riccia sorocarpa]|uniref:CCHC-type domain-containing protein n=1 Tax=Riccia sorocarpa TaxID=122646 RepID=A0ABD3GQD4_9MARC
MLVRNKEDRDAIFAASPYKMRNRVVFLTPYEPGHNPQSNVGKKMPVWLDLLNVDPMLESEGRQMLATLGPEIHQAGMIEGEGGKFPHIRGCVLMDINKPLPTVLKVMLNGGSKSFGIHYDTLPDACYTCHQRGHFQRFCPLTCTTRPAPEEKQKTREDADGFQQVNPKGRASPTDGNGNRKGNTISPPTAASNPYQALDTTVTENEEEEEIPNNDEEDEEIPNNVQINPTPVGSPSKSWGDIAEEEEMEAAKEEAERRAAEEKSTQDQGIPDSQHNIPLESATETEKDDNTKKTGPSLDLNATPALE